LDFPALDDPGDPHAPAELLTAHPDVANAISRIVSAAGHMAAVVCAPFLTLCDAGMGYHLPSCLRFLETAHIPELLREAGTGGLHAREISARIGVESVKTSHILRLLATHHLLRELRPDVFALNRISGLLDSGKSFDELQIQYDKYDGIGGKAAFVALNTDELFKASAYLTDFLLPHRTAFNLSQRTRSSFWAWLEAPGNEARLKRFGRAMGGSEAWEGDGEGLGAHPFPGLPPDALVVDVGGGIGSSTMRLAGMFPRLRFVVQDRAAVCRIGEEAWRARCPELIEGGRVKFQGPIRAPAVFLVRVVCHDWPDALARRMLLQLRRAAREFGDGEGEEGTYLVIGDHVLPYAVAGEGGCLKGIEGARDVQTLRGAKWPLLANLGKASANAYWMDLTMQVTFNGQERTLPELVALAASAGWRIVRVAGTEGSLFGHIVAVP
ncbi:S-adenosyl-L-methionine-dependent methyltransferase, partial [Amylostereum chailletii]